MFHVRLTDTVATAVRDVHPATMLDARIRDGYGRGLREAVSRAAVSTLVGGPDDASAVAPSLLATTKLNCNAV